jgi:hypothetical protein
VNQFSTGFPSPPISVDAFSSKTMSWGWTWKAPPV